MSSAWKLGLLALNCSLKLYYQQRHRCKSFGKKHQWGWESRSSSVVPCVRCTSWESRSLGLERKLGGKFHLKLNIDSRPIANKYHEGKMKRTLERELKVPEIAEREANGSSVAWWDCCMLWWVSVSHLQRFTCGVVVLLPIIVVDLALRFICHVCVGKPLGSWKHALGCVNVPCCTHTNMAWWVNGSFRPVLKHGPRSLTYVRVHGWLNLLAQWKWLLGFLHQQLTDRLREVWVWAYVLGPERWWTMPGQGEVRGNSDGSS